MNGEPDVGHDRFRPRRRDFEETSRLFHNLVAHIIQRSFLRLVDDFFIRQRGLRRPGPS